MTQATQLCTLLSELEVKHWCRWVDPLTELWTLCYSPGAENIGLIADNTFSLWGIVKSAYELRMNFLKEENCNLFLHTNNQFVECIIYRYKVGGKVRTL